MGNYTSHKKSTTQTKPRQSAKVTINAPQPNATTSVPPLAPATSAELSDEMANYYKDLLTSRTHGRLVQTLNSNPEPSPHVNAPPIDIAQLLADTKSKHQQYQITSTDKIPPTLYAIECADGYLYLDITTTLQSRIDSHMAGGCAVWTMIHKPLSFTTTPCDSHESAHGELFRCTILIMKHYGIDKVRSGIYPDPVLTPAQLAEINYHLKFVERPIAHFDSTSA